MAAEGKVKGMKWVLVIAGLISLIYWGILLVFIYPGMPSIYGAPYPTEPIYVRTIGMLFMVLGLFFLLASRDPVKNLLVVNVGIINYVLMVIFAIVTMFITQEAVGFAWLIILFLSVIFLILFILFRPKAAKA